MAIDLGKPVGPLPLGLWIAGGGIGAGLLYLRTRAGAAPAGTTPGLSPLNTVGDGSQSLFIQQAPPTPVEPQAITTNQEWFLKATADLIARNYDAVLVDQALRKYLLGVANTPQEWVIVKLALLYDGEPPEPFGPSEGGTPPGSVPIGGDKPPSSAPGPVVIPVPAKLHPQYHQVGQVGHTYVMSDYIKTIYPTASQFERYVIQYCTVLDPRNAPYRSQLAVNRIPGGAPITFVGKRTGQPDPGWYQTI